MVAAIAGKVGLGLLKFGGKLFFGGPIRATASSAATVYGANHVGNQIAPEFTQAARDKAADLGGRAVDAVTGAAKEMADDKIADMVYNNIFSKFGFGREEFDEWYEKIDPIETAAVFASLEGVNMAVKAVGMKGFSHSSLAFAAIAFRFADEYGLLDKVGDLLVDNNILERDTVEKIPFIGSFNGAAEDVGSNNNPQEQPEEPKVEPPASTARTPDEMAPVM
jgi:hypothetical protein